jgi:hypothetical protein
VTSRSALVGTGVESGTEEADEACSRVDEGESLAIPIRRRCGTTGNDESKQHEPQQESTISHHQSDAPRSSTSSRQPLADDSPGRPDHYRPERYRAPIPSRSGTPERGRRSGVTAHIVGQEIVVIAGGEGHGVR